MRQLILAAVALAWAGAATAQTATCILDLNVTDQDPAGLNVRASPGGPIIAAVEAKKRWVQVEVTGQNGAWARITSATLEADENGESADTVLWKGVGWVAFSKLGIGYFYGGTRFRAAPDEHAKVVLSLAGYRDSTAPPAEAILGCDGGWLKVRVKGVVGWTDQWCDDEGALTCASQTATDDPRRHPARGRA